MWPFDRLPETEYQAVLDKWEKQDFIGLAMLYKKYKVMPDGVCPNCAFQAIKIWTEYGIKVFIKPEPKEV